MRYYLNMGRPKGDSGTRKIHRETCYYALQIYRPRDLGEHESDAEALEEARSIYGQAQPCRTCCID